MSKQALGTPQAGAGRRTASQRQCAATHSSMSAGGWARSSATGKLVEGGVTERMERIFADLAQFPETAGKSFADVVHAGVCLTDITSFSSMSAVYAKHIERPYPARTTIGVTALPRGADVEIGLVVQDAPRTLGEAR